MTLRARVILIVTGLVVFGISVASLAAYRSAAGELASETDAFLVARADEVVEGTRAPPRQQRGDDDGDGDGDGDRRRPGSDDLELSFDPDAIVQVLDEDGQVVASEGGVLPVETADEAVAADGKKAVIRDIGIDGETYRMITAPQRDGGAVQVAQATTSTSDVLDRLAGRLVLIGGVLAVVAGVLGWLLMRRATKPLEELTAATERVAATRDLTPLGLSGNDEVGRLGGSFDEMLAALRTSREQQRRLVQDAGHELRTPLTSLRANVEFLQRAEELPADERADVLDGVLSELAELGTLVDEVVVLATDDMTAEAPMSDLDLAEIVADAVATFQRRTERTVTVSAEPTPVRGNVALLDRAVTNLLSNAHKFSPLDQPIEVVLADRWVLVRDHGDGIDPADAERIFDRFHRADSARSQPGSGLGLAIVQYVAEQHGGSARAGRAPGGGAEVGFSVG